MLYNPALAPVQQQQAYENPRQPQGHPLQAGTHIPPDVLIRLFQQMRSRIGYAPQAAQPPQPPPVANGMVHPQNFGGTASQMAQDPNRTGGIGAQVSQLAQDKVQNPQPITPPNYPAAGRVRAY